MYIGGGGGGGGGGGTTVMLSPPSPPPPPPPPPLYVSLLVMHTYPKLFTTKNGPHLLYNTGQILTGSTSETGKHDSLLEHMPALSFLLRLQLTNTGPEQLIYKRNEL